MSHRRKIAVAVGVVILSGLLFTAFVLPSIVRSQLEKQLGSAIGRKCSVAGVSLNPLTWSAEVRGVEISEKTAKAVFVSVSSVKLRVSPTSIWRLAPVVAELKVTSPYLHLLRTAPHSYNFSDILAKFSAKKSDKPARFSLNNIIVENGRIAFDDNALSRPAKHRIESLSLQIPFISNISYFADKYIDPKLSADVNGATFSFSGKLKPFEKGLEATLHIHLQRVDIPIYASYFPQELPVQIKQGTFSTILKISHHLIQGGKPDIIISGLAGVRDLEIQEKSGAPLFSLAKTDIDIKRLALLTQKYEMNSLAITAPHLYLHGDKDGVWNLSRLARKEPAAPATAAPPEAERKPARADVSLQSLRLIDGLITLKDEHPPGGNSAEFRKVTLDLDNFTTKGELPATYTLSLTSNRNETAAASGNIAMEPFAVSARITLTDIVHEAYYPYMLHLLAEPVNGRIDCRGDLAYSAAAGLTLEQVMLRLKNVKIPFGKADGAYLPLIVAEGGSLKLQDRSLAFARVTASGGTVNISRDPSGKLSSALLFREKSPAASPVTAGKQPNKPFSWKIGRAAVNGLKLAFTDNMKEEKPRFEFSSITASLSSISDTALAVMPLALKVKGGAFAPQGSANRALPVMPLALNITYGTKGSVTATGGLRASPWGFKGDIAIRSLPFVDFDPYLPEGVNVDLLDGKLDAQLSLDLSMQEKMLAGSFRGSGDIRDFHSVDGEEEEDLLKWEILDLDGFSGSLAPFSLVISGISLNNYYAKVVVNKNGRINLQDIYKPAAKVKQVDTAIAGGQKTPPDRNIRINTVSFSGGTLDFSDHHLNRDFSTTMLNLGGRISGLSSEDGSAADVDLRGNLENHSPLKISGRINPLADSLFLDMQIAFSEIELSPFTPYAGTYLGYAIDKGKLSLALNYKVEQKKLTAQNKVFIDQFTFGESIESRKATSLPVRLAVALLKDRNGEIHLDLPLSGRTDSPQFSIWGLIGQVLKNLLVKAATSPLALLQAGFGGKADFGDVTFASGSSRLSSSEAEKLRSLAKALSERPGIRLEVTGFADRDRDPEGFRNELLLKKMKSEKFLSLAREKRESSGLSHDTVEIPAAEQSKWLKAVYEKEKFPRPRTVIGTLKALSDDEMKKLILANTSVSEQQLRGLARERAVTVMNFLLEDGKLPQERLFEKSGDPFAASDKEGKAGGRVEFGAVAR
jgi:uncharacterized protein involved in outer membrane biogenesis